MIQEYMFGPFSQHVKETPFAARPEDMPNWGRSSTICQDSFSSGGNILAGPRVQRPGEYVERS